ncbi:MAG: D-glycero-beta-D-manno-heptose 1-phosphate adenylyltransferase [Candidatus Wallbacteria bacterium]|nr:D-glycero-beta-D-manno-heptose 1-phosphate adenylyltransferase [Candidatus Wallbacteria bacterium]
MIAGSAAAIRIIRAQQKSGKTVVFTNGCFDILHRGHLKVLREAKTLGDFLVVALNSDDSVKRLKGPSRPLNKLSDREEVLDAVRFVDLVTSFDEDTPWELLSKLKPDILVKGGDYQPDQVVGRELVKKVVIVPFEEGYSTTDLINRTKK